MPCFLFLQPVALQSCIYFGITETPVHFGTIEEITVLGKYNALYLVCPSLVLEAYFHALTLQVGYKYIPVSTPANLFLRMSYSSYFVLSGSFNRLRLTLSFPFAMCKPYFKVSSLQMRVLRNRSFLSEWCFRCCLCG